MNCFCGTPTRTITIQVILLDDSEYRQEVSDHLPGRAILEQVFSQLNLTENSYFGCRYQDSDNQTHWLDASLRISKQLKHTVIEDTYKLYFGVKFYAADPTKLQEEITRYQLYLQVKQDVLQGRIPVSFDAACELGALVVQSELGDFNPRKHTPGYVTEFRLVPNQTRELGQRMGARIAAIHQQLKGLTPTFAELKYLDKVKWHDMYGVDLHLVLGEDSMDYYLGLAPSGVLVLRDKTTVAHYYWPRIVKVSHKGKYFMMRVCDKNNEINTYGFETPKKAACKHLYRSCTDHHTFFRMINNPNPSSIAASGGYGKATSSNGITAVNNTERHNSMSHRSRNSSSNFTRLPSNRQSRQSHEAMRYNSQSGDSTADATFYNKREEHRISIPHLMVPEVVPAATKDHFQSGGSPKSERSMGRSRERGLFGASPRSQRRDTSQKFRHRSSSVESQSSYDSRPSRRYKSSGGRSRRQSDNESELSRGSSKSGTSHHSCRKQRRHRSRRRSRDEFSDIGSVKTGTYSEKKGNYELVDSELQWREVQRKKAAAKDLSSGVVQQASVTNLVSNSTVNSNGNTNSLSNSRGRKHHRRHRSSNNGNANGHNLWNMELAKHLQFDLIDTAGMSEDQLREIPYTIVETTKVSDIHPTYRMDRMRP